MGSCNGFDIYRFNKREEDFPSLREYNDYLEEVEDMSTFLFLLFLLESFWIFLFEEYLCMHKLPFLSLAAFNLIEGIDAPAIEEKIAKYQEENAEQIMVNRARKVFDNIFFLIFIFIIIWIYFRAWFYLMADAIIGWGVGCSSGSKQGTSYTNWQWRGESRLFSCVIDPQWGWS